ncbi:MAG: hypothetical protein RLZZ67_98 [Candidatus Parcubacteria bacterium]|jgi:hypothetical protein
MFESEKRSPLDRLKKGLYSRNDSFGDAPRHDIHPQKSVVPESWVAPESTEPVSAPYTIHKTRKAYHIVFIASFFFFLVAAAVAGYTFFGGKNFVSADNVDILVEGPASIGGGEPLSLNISVVNKNSTDIQLVDLIVEYPAGSKDVTDPAKDISKFRLSLGDIKSQSLVQKTLSSLMYGEEGDKREIRFAAEYRTANSNAIFVKEKSYIISISSSPVTVSIDARGKILGGQASDIKVTVSSNTTSVIKNLLLSLEYPFGFTVLSASPAATFGDGIWRIGDLAPGAKKVITLKASAEGQDEESKTVKAHVGIQSDTDEREIATNIISRNHTFTIERPFLGLDLTLDGNRGDATTEAGRTVRAEIIWTNNSLTKITNARIEAKLSGNVLDKNSVSVDGGYYDSLTNTVIWEAGRTSGFDSLAPSGTGRVGFNVRSMNASSGSIPQNPSITVSVSGKGDRLDENGVPSEITSGVSRSIKLVSNMALSARVLRGQGPISNTGPIPPRVDEVTSYTVIWTVTNTSNSITGARVTAALPPQVSWTNVVSPADSGLTYDSNGGNITWVVGAVPRNATVGSGARQVSFQVAIRPSANQKGTAPEVIGTATLIGTDTFTGATLRNSTSALSTRTSTDSLYKNGDDLVTQ